MYMLRACVFFSGYNGHFALTDLPNEFDLDALMLESFPRTFQRYVDFSGDRFTVIEQKMSVLLPVFRLVLHFPPRLCVVQDHVDVCALTKTKEAHPCDETGHDCEVCLLLS